MDDTKNQNYFLFWRPLTGFTIISSLVITMICFMSAFSAFAELPHLEKNGYGANQLIVHGKPFLMIGGETNNSSGSHIPHMEKLMQMLRERNLNSVFVAVSWEIVERKEGVFDFTSLDELIRIARKNDMKLGVLWFASWKNGISPYAPSWVLQNTEKYRRVKDEKGQNTKTLTPLCKATLEADKRAYIKLMEHIAQVDAEENTVIVMQIENEVGVTRQTRDFSPEAEKAFQSSVPEALIDYMQSNKETLEIELKTAWAENGFKTKGTWTDIFGKNDQTDLFFMAWHYSRYLDEIAEAGKKVYNIPMFANCWMSMPRPNPGKPGDYPSGGPVLAVLDIWKAGAPFIDFLAPDIYGEDLKVQADNFHRHDNPLFIPETRSIMGPATYAFCEHDAICFSPFGIDSNVDLVATEYALLAKLSPIILENQGGDNMQGFYKTKDDSIGPDIKLNDDIMIEVRYGNLISQDHTEQDIPCYGVFIKTGENEFLLAGNNLSVMAKSTNHQKMTWLKDAWEGTYENGVWKPIVLHNGDEAGFLRSDEPTYFIGQYQTNPSAPAIFRFKVILYDK